MFNLRLYKPIITILLKFKKQNNKIFISNEKLYKKLQQINRIDCYFYVSNKKVCFFTLKYKTQLNILHQSRFKLRHDITFNKNNTFTKFTK